MKRIILLRHSKARRDIPDIADIERPLSVKGINDAGKMGAFFEKLNIFPDIVFCSSAVRTRMTADNFFKQKKDFQIIFDKDIYYDCFGATLKIISNLKAELNSVMIIGHNPDLLELTGYLTGAAFPFTKFSTTGIAVLETDSSDWKKTPKNSCRLISFHSPRII